MSGYNLMCYTVLAKWSSTYRTNRAFFDNVTPPPPPKKKNPKTGEKRERAMKEPSKSSAPRNLTDRNQVKNFNS